MNNDFSKTLKNYGIIYLPELPSDNKYMENTMVASRQKKKASLTYIPGMRANGYILAPLISLILI